MRIDGELQKKRNYVMSMTLTFMKCDINIVKYVIHQYIDFD